MHAIAGSPLRRSLAAALLLAAAAGAGIGRAGGRSEGRLPNLLAAPNPSGEARTYSARALDLSNPFFESLGTNGRACATCHVPADGWSIVPAHVRARFEATEGQDPLFRPVDGATSPRADVSTLEARRAAYRLLLDRGLVRIGLPVPPGAEFELVAVDDPYGYASEAELSLFRRPLPATNLAFLSTVMWDGREGPGDRPLPAALADQAEHATRGHAEAARPLAPEEREAIVDFETSLFTAQWRDVAAGPLHAAGALGGPRHLADQDFFIGINTGDAFDPAVFTLFDRWARAEGGRAEARRAVARGQRLFAERTFGATGATCGSCHNAPGAGSSSTPRFFDLGLTAAARRPPDLPLYTLRCRTTGQVVATTDPGRALVTGRCADIGRFKPPVLRGLAARAPYFHDGSAATVDEVVAFYDRRFGIGLADAEKADLAAFLRAL